ncbi:hypothetical protein BIY29_01270 [Brenneria alni]|uniref:Uncharacterized protein n=1 Tax=Brenneria alni TaxID=71656 RepID=A0A421DT83_9GAMM|nr:type III effector [Brenneria alni]RLM27743.1 hypothetical protein BIY29_01270 [Brenneria alni]
MNPIHDRYFPGGVTVNPLENFSREHVVKLHDAVSAQTLGIGTYESKRVIVSTSTMEHLQLTQDTLRKVKMMLPYGAGNQAADVIYTGGESMARTNMIRETPFSHPAQSARESARHQAGNCQEYALLSYTLLAQQPINAPVSLVQDKNWCHIYVLIGDPRDQVWGEKNTVVVDPWVRYPSATTLQESRNRTPDLSALYQCACNAEEVQSLNQIKHVTSYEVSRFLDNLGTYPLGDEYLESLFQDEDGSRIFDEKLVAKDPSTRYSNSSSPFNARSMDDIAQATVSRQRAAQQVWDNSPY